MGAMMIENEVNRLYSLLVDISRVRVPLINYYRNIVSFVLKFHRIGNILHSAIVNQA